MLALLACAYKSLEQAFLMLRLDCAALNTFVVSVHWVVGWCAAIWQVQAQLGSLSGAVDAFWRPTQCFRAHFKLWGAMVFLGFWNVYSNNGAFGVQYSHPIDPILSPGARAFICWSCLSGQCSLWCTKQKKIKWRIPCEGALGFILDVAKSNLLRWWNDQVGAYLLLFSHQ